MKVYIIIPLNSTFSGCALVAANSKEEAKKLYIQENDGSFMYKEGNCYIREFEEIYCNGEKEKVLMDTISSDY